MGNLDGFCSYLTQFAQKQAIRLLNRTVIAGNQVDVKLPNNPHRKVIVKNKSDDVENKPLNKELFSVILSNLPLSITTDDLIPICGKYRSLYSVRVLSKNNEQSNGHAVCLFTTELCRNQAIIDLDQTLIGGQRVKAKCISAFIGNLSPSITTDDLISLFEKYPGFDSVRIITIPGTEKFRYGFCNFTNESSRDQVIKDFDDTLIDGRRVRLNISKKG